LTAILTLAMAGVMLADVYDHSGTNGDFTDGKWLNHTTSPPGGPNIYGNPGASDDAYFYGATVTASGGGVHLVSGDNLTLSGTLTAVNVGLINALSGAGTLDVQALVTDANGFAGVNIAGGHLKAQNGDGVGSVAAGGTVVDAICSGTNGCGNYDGGSSLTITGLGSGPKGQANFFNASTLTASGGLQDFGLNFQSGSTGNVSTINRGSATVNGSGSNLTVAGDFLLNSSSLTASSGGVVTVNGKLTQNNGVPVYATGSGSILTVGQDFSLTGGSIQINSGGAVRVGTLTQNRSSVSLDGGNSTLTVDQDFSLMAGFLDISAGGTLTVNGQLVLDGGKDLSGNTIGGGGNWKGPGTTISTSQEMDIGNASSGGFSIAVGNGAAVRTGYAFVGVGSAATGTVDLSGAGTLWEVQSSGMAVGGNGTGNFDISSEAHLLFGDETAFAVGFNSGSHGRMTVDGAGSVLDASKAAARIGANAGSVGSVVLTNGAQATFGQEAFIGKAGSGSLSLASGSQVSVTGGSNTTFGVADDADSTGTISIEGGSNLRVDARFLIGTGGNGFVGVGTGGMVQSSVLLLGGASNALGTVTVNGAGSIWNSSSDVFIGNSGKGAGKLTVSSGGAFNVLGETTKFGIANEAGTTGELDVDGSGSRVTGSRFIAGVDGAATMRITNGGSLQTGEAAIASSSTSSGDVLVSGAGSLWTVTGFALYVGGIANDTGFNQGGPATLTVANGGLVLVSELIDIARLGKIVLSGGAVGVGTNANPAVNTLRVAADGLLIGYGRVQGQVIVAQGGQILPGNSPGILTIDGNYTQEAGSTFYAELGGSDPGTSYDQVQVSGQATLAGNLQVRLTNGFTPAVGQTFRILSAGSISGVFTSILEPSQVGISLTSDATGVTVTVTSVTTGAPVITGATTAVARPGLPFTYQIAATNNPTSFGATNLPAGLSVDNNTGLISGTPTTPGAFIVPINANNAAGSGQADLMILIDPGFGSAALPPSNLVNISTRLNVQTGDNVLIGGFIITGTVPKKVLIRAIGPSLPLAGVLANPTLELYQGTTLLESNDNWMDSANKQAIIDSTIPPTNPLESAIVRSLPPGNYTAIERGVNNGTGIGVVEAYDLDTSANSKLANISTRGLVQTGDNVLFAGTIVVGQASQKVIIRALGPSTGVPGAMADPTLELHDGNGALLEANDNWVDSPNKQAIIDSTIPPPNNAESAIVRILTPANYTAIVRGVNNSTGIAVVEVYALN
jgi:T5SS/PEP-CTERM-associated repeat protein